MLHVDTRRSDTLQRMARAVEKVEERLQRAVSTLEAHHIPYAVIGGKAVAAWVAQVDEEAVRRTKDVDVLIERGSLPRMIVAMETVGFQDAAVADFWI